MSARRTADPLHLAVRLCNLPVLRHWRILLLCFALLPAAAFAETQAEANSCAKCHADIVKGLAGSPHGGNPHGGSPHGGSPLGGSSAEHSGSIATCESCHGSGEAHIGSNGDAARIQNPARLSAAEADTRCLACHATRHPNFSRSIHAAASVSCVSCHSVHSGKDAKLLKTTQPALCYKCHAGIESQFAEPVHHKTGDGPVQCTACHDPHANFETQLQSSIHQQVTACLKCHTELAGPWVYEHRAVKQAGCVACHTPHGDKYPKLLTEANVNTVCLQCHLPSATFSDVQVNSAHTSGSTRLCTSCHVSIHGSNHEDRFTHP